MQKNVKSYAKWVLPAFVSLAFFVSGCGTFGDKKTDEAKKYEVAQAMDSGNYDKAVSMLEKNCAGYSYEECQLNLGAAYFGKAGFDIIGLGKDLVKIDSNTTDDPAEEATYDQWKETQMMVTLLDRITDRSVKEGSLYYKKLLDNNGSECKADDSDPETTDYSNLTTMQKQACIAINPILLQEILSDESDTESVAVDLETVVDFKDVLTAAVPDIQTAELVNLISGGTISEERDYNQNGKVDKMEATNCTLKAFKGGYDDTVCSEANTPGKYFTFVQRVQDVNIANYGIYDVVRSKLTDSGMTKTKSFTRLVKLGDDFNTTVTVVAGKFVDANGTEVSDCNASAPAATCYPMPKQSVPGTDETLSTTVVNVLNNDKLLESMAILSDSSKDKSSAVKIIDFKEKLCGDIYDSNGVINQPALAASDCKDPEGDPTKVVISQDALLEYMDTTK